MKLSFSLLLALLGVALGETRVVMYYDQWHPGQSNAISAANLEGVTHVILAFMLSHHLNNDTIAADTFSYTEPGHLWHKETAAKIREANPKTKIMLAIGGWNDDPVKGWRKAIESPATISKFASNVKSVLDTLQLDGVDIDWEYPGGHAVDWLTTGTPEKIDEQTEIKGYVDLLAAIKSAIGGDRLLSIAVPGKPNDMIAFDNPTNGEAIYKSVDFVNIMTYDIKNRRDETAGHHTSAIDSLATVDKYLENGLKPGQAVLGFAFYAKWFSVLEGCTAIGCTLADLEDANGADNGLSGSMTFEAKNLKPANKDAPQATEGKCGPEVELKCGSPYCCSYDGWCGDSKDHCGIGKCDPDYSGEGSTCQGPNLRSSWQEALANKVVDDIAGGVSYIDKPNNIFWTWDSADIMQRKVKDIVVAKNLGGVMAWSYGEENFDTMEHINVLKEAGKASASGQAPSPSPSNGGGNFADNGPKPSASSAAPPTPPEIPSTFITSTRTPNAAPTPSPSNIAMIDGLDDDAKNLLALLGNTGALIKTSTRPDGSEVATVEVPLS